MLRRKCLKLIGASTSVGAFGAGTAVAGETTSVKVDGVRFLNFGLPGGAPSSGVTLTVDGRHTARELQFGEFSSPVDLSSGEYTVEMTDTQANVTASTTMTVDSSDVIVSLVGGTNGTQPSVMVLRVSDLFSTRGVRVANLTDADELIVSAGRGESRINRGSISEISRVEDTGLRVATDGSEYSTNTQFNCLSLDAAPTVVIGGSVTNAAAPVGAVAVHEGDN